MQQPSYFDGAGNPFLRSSGARVTRYAAAKEISVATCNRAVVIKGIVRVVTGDTNLIRNVDTVDPRERGAAQFTASENSAAVSTVETIPANCYARVEATRNIQILVGVRKRHARSKNNGHSDHRQRN